jgi:hypothetical protein
MASFQFTRSVPSQGTMFVFGSWVCIADGAGSLRQFLVDMKPKTPAVSFHRDLDKFIDDPLRGSRRSLLSARLHPALQQPCLGWIRSNLRSHVIDHDSIYPICPLIFRRPISPSPSPYWRRTWTLYSNSESPKPPHVGRLRVVLVSMV